MFVEWRGLELIFGKSVELNKGGYGVDAAANGDDVLDVGVVETNVEYCSSSDRGSDLLVLGFESPFSSIEFIFCSYVEFVVLEFNRGAVPCISKFFFRKGYGVQFSISSFDVWNPVHDLSMLRKTFGSALLGNEVAKLLVLVVRQSSKRGGEGVDR